MPKERALGGFAREVRRTITNNGEIHVCKEHDVLGGIRGCYAFDTRVGPTSRTRGWKVEDLGHLLGD
jgi:hypothetical protein